MAVARYTINLGRKIDRLATRMFTPLAAKMARSKTLGNVAIEVSNLTGQVADFLGFSSWQMGSSLDQAATRENFRSYSDLIEAFEGKAWVDKIGMPKSWQIGPFKAAWSTSEFVTMVYFAGSLHVQILVGLMFPSIAKEMSETVGGFAAEFGISTGLAAAFTFGMVSGHHTGHVLEAAKTYSLEPSLQETLGAKLVEKHEDGTVTFRTNTKDFWLELGRLLLLAPTGRHEAVIKDGFNYRVNGTPTDPVLAAGPRFDRWVNRLAGVAFLPMFAVAAGMRAVGLEAPEILAFLVPKGMALTTIAFLGKKQDNGALKKYEAKLAEDARLEAQVAAGTLEVDAGREAVDANAASALKSFVTEPRNFAVYGGTDHRFAGWTVFAPDGFHNAFQAGRHTAFETASGSEGNTSPDVLGQEKWIVLRPEANPADAASRGFYGTLRDLPKLQNQVVGEILDRDGVSGGGRENEGGVSGNFYGGGDEAAVSLLMEAAAKAGAKNGYRYGENLFLGLDHAADSIDMFNPENGMYTWQGQQRSGDEMVRRYVDNFYQWKHLLAFEDPFAAPRSQWGFWQQLTAALGDKMLVIGDDIFCTNPSLAYDGLKMGVANSGLVKLNQVGSFVQAWMYMELFHSSGRQTVISHRSTQPDTQPDPMEVTAALAASFRDDARTVGAKLGGVFLSSRAGLFYEMQKALEKWRNGTAITPGMGPDVTIASVQAFPSPLGGGKYGLMTAMVLSNGVEITSPIPGGLSRGEGETTLVGPEAGMPIVQSLVAELGLVGLPLGAIRNVFEIERRLMAIDIREAQKAGKLPSYSPSAWEIFESEAAYKTMIGGDVSLSLGQLLMKAVALRDGLPPWLVYRMEGLAFNQQFDFSFGNYPEAKKAFYEPIFKGEVGQEALGGTSAKIAITAVPEDIRVKHIFRDPGVLASIDADHVKELGLLQQVFVTEGSLAYDLELRDETGGVKAPYMRVREGSRIGLAEHWASQVANEGFTRSSGHKGATFERREIWTDWVNAERREKPELTGKHLIAIPNRFGARRGEVTLLLGSFDESISPARRLKLFSEYFDSIVRFADDRHYSVEDATVRTVIETAFARIPIHEFFESQTGAIFEKYVRPVLVDNGFQSRA